MTDTPTPTAPPTDPPGSLRCATCGSLMSTSDSATAEWVLTEHVKREHPEAIPSSLLPAIVRGLDLDAMRTAAPVLHAELVGLLRDSTRQIRQARGRVVAAEDTYDLTRRLTAAGEVMRQWRDAFDAAGRECDALLAEEAITAVGEADGIPLGSHFVPDGAGQRIAVRADYGSGGDQWDLASLVGWIAEDEAQEQVASLGDLSSEQEDTAVRDYRDVARTAMERLLALGRFAPSVTAIDSLRLRHAEQGHDAEAAILGQLRTRGARIYKGVKVTREPMPKSKRGA